MGQGNLQYAVLGLIASKEDGTHGYRLKTDCQAISDEFWQVNYGRLYRVLDLLERDGELNSQDFIQHGRPNRKVFRITEQGRRTLDDWLLQPVDEQGQPLRDELILKLLFLGADDTTKLHRLIKDQRAIYLKRLGKLARRRRQLEKAGVDMRATELVLDGAAMRVRADITWIEHVERTLIKEARH
ncbi:MAG: PadR family transcriptional regulator AphA [Hyphomicrobiaceae bacterium]|jgi:PadR family transcriptional regulator AphA